MTTTSQSPSSTCPNSYPSAPSPFDLQCASCAGSVHIQAPRAHPQFACVKRHSSTGSSNPPCRIICSTISINEACMCSTYGDNANNPCSSCTIVSDSFPSELPKFIHAYRLGKLQCAFWRLLEKFGSIPEQQEFRNTSPSRPPKLCKHTEQQHSKFWCRFECAKDECTSRAGSKGHVFFSSHEDRAYECQQSRFQ